MIPKVPESTKKIPVRCRPHGYWAGALLLGWSIVTDNSSDISDNGSDLKDNGRDYFDVGNDFK